jgi:hypothetical protein
VSSWSSATKSGLHMLWGLLMPLAAMAQLQVAGAASRTQDLSDETYRSVRTDVLLGVGYGWGVSDGDGPVFYLSPTLNLTGMVRFLAEPHADLGSFRFGIIAGATVTLGRGRVDRVRELTGRGYRIRSVDGCYLQQSLLFLKCLFISLMYHETDASIVSLFDYPFRARIPVMARTTWVVVGRIF